MNASSESHQQASGEESRESSTECKSMVQEVVVTPVPSSSTTTATKEGAEYQNPYDFIQGITGSSSNHGFIKPQEEVR